MFFFFFAQKKVNIETRKSTYILMQSKLQGGGGLLLFRVTKSQFQKNTEQADYQIKFYKSKSKQEDKIIVPLLYHAAKVKLKAENTFH